MKLVRCKKCRDLHTAKRYKVKREVFEKYGGCKCACCGDTEIVWLSIDHIDGGGNKHRKELKNKCGVNFYNWLKKQNYPDGYQVLCMNCQFGKHACGICPHQLKRENNDCLFDDSKSGDCC